MPRELEPNLVCARFADELQSLEGSVELHGKYVRVEASTDYLFGEAFTSVELAQGNKYEVWGFDEVAEYLEISLDTEPDKSLTRSSLILLPGKIRRKKYEGPIARLALTKRAQRSGLTLIESGHIVTSKSSIDEKAGGLFSSVQEVIDASMTLAQALGKIKPFNKVVVTAPRFVS